MSRPWPRPVAWWSGWVALLGGREPGTALALFRIVTGLSLLLSLGSVVASDVVELLWVDVEHGGYRSIEGGWLVQALGGATPRVVWALVGACGGAGLLLTLGLLTRASALVAGQSLLALSTLNPDARSAYDPLLVDSLWLLVLADSSATLSLRCRLRAGRWTSDRPVAVWPRYLVIAQLTVLYFGTGLNKISIHWTPAGGFSALYYILQQPSWQRGDMRWVASVYPLTQVATAVTWLWELTWPVVPLALWLRHTAERGGRLRRLFARIPVRAIYVAIGLCMHLTSTTVMVIGPFAWITLAYYPCLFRADELRRGHARLVASILPSRWLRSRSVGSSSSPPCDGVPSSSSSPAP
ncbi:MAG: HTTM domain-containing protein [Myxococcales bacterium]|nr:HTTM domain-containing protein [Myxococcales bacterium]MCB9715795.1 HTTM domain-containing protein [Myxococcales bacterium]